MNDFFVFRTVSGLFDVPLDELRPQFGLERRKEKSHFANSAYFSSCPVPIPPRFQSRREDGEGALNRRRSPCHALAFTRVRTRVCDHTHRRSVRYLRRPAHLLRRAASWFAGSICCWRRRLGGGDSSFEFGQLWDLLGQVGKGI